MSRLAKQDDRIRFVTRGVARGAAALVLLFAAVAYVIAEDITLTTYYPSPRGVYQTLRSTGQTTLAELGGNVGIGTTTPDHFLHIRGAGSEILEVQGTGTDSNPHVAITNDARTYLLQTVGARGDNFEIWDSEGGAARLAINTSGNVGIGTTGPASKLHVVGDQVYIQGNSGAGWAALDVNNGGNGPIALFRGNGNVGIGMTGPARLLQLGNNSDAEVIRIGRTDNTHTVGIGATGFGSNLLLFAAGTERMRVDGGGNVGIGTTSPVQKLHVDGTSEILSTGSGAGFKFRMRDGGTDSVWYGSGNVSRFWRSDVGDIIGINSAGNVGIGTTGPDERLHVAGNIHATGVVRADSDARFKQDLQPLTNVLATLDGLTPLSYAPNALAIERGQTPDQRQLGLLGQELEQVYPELVAVSESEGYRSVDYSRLSVVLLEAMKELKAEVDRLRARIKDLEKPRP